MQGVGGWLALYILVMIIQTATNYISAYGACKAELYIGRDLKRETFNHLQTLSFSYFNQNSVGYTHARVMSDTDRIASTLAWGLMEAVWHCVSAAGNRDDVCAQLEAGAVRDGHCAGAGDLGRVFPEKLVFFTAACASRTRRSPARSTRASPARRRPKRWSLRTRSSRNSTI